MDIVRSIILAAVFSAALLPNASVVCGTSDTQSAIPRFSSGTSGGWAATWGGIERNPDIPPDSYLGMANNSDIGRAVAVGDDGGIYVAGSFDSTTDFDPGESEVIENGPGGYLSKFTDTGGLVWVKILEAAASDIFITSDGNVYLTTQFLETTDSSGDDNKASLICCIDPDGNYVWSRSWGIQGDCIAVSETGKVLIGGNFWGPPVSIEPGSVNAPLIATGHSAAYLSRLTTDGDYIDTAVWDWIQPDDFSETSDEKGHIRIMDMQIDPDGNVYIGGDFGDMIDFDPGEGVDERDGRAFSTNYLCKLDPDLNYIWARTWAYKWISNGLGLAVSPDGNIYVTGDFQWFEDFDPGPGEDWHESISDYDIFVTSFTSSGDFRWAQTWGGRARETGGSVTVADDGSVYVTGLFQLAADLDPGPGVEMHENASAGGCFILKFTDMGDFVWADSIRPTGEGEVGGNDIELDSDGNIYVTGSYSGLVDFNPGEGEALLKNVDGFRDVFLVKLNPDGSF